MPDWLGHVETADARLVDVSADRAQYLIRHGSMRAGLYAPIEDDQQPHAQDELYIVNRGRARFRRADELYDIQPGHLIFVPAGMEHRFEAMSDDFATYVVFWGPENGEAER